MRPFLWFSLLLVSTSVYPGDFSPTKLVLPCVEAGMKGRKVDLLDEAYMKESDRVISTVLVSCMRPRSDIVSVSHAKRMEITSMPTSIARKSCPTEPTVDASCSTSAWLKNGSRNRKVRRSSYKTK